MEPGGAVDRGDAVGELVDVVLVEVDVAAEGQAPVAGLHQDGVQGHLDTLVGGLADVGVGAREAGDRRQGHVHQQVLGTVPVEVDGTGQAAVQHAEVEADVAGDGGLPLQVGVGHGGADGVGAVLLVGDGVVAAAGLPGLRPQVGVDAVVTDGTVGEAELEVVQPVGILHEGLLADAPREGRGGEVTPAVCGSELAGTVRAERDREEVAVQQRVVQPAEEGQDALRGAVARVELAGDRRGAGVELVDHREGVLLGEVGREVVGGDGHRVAAGVGHLVAHQEVQAVGVAELQLVVQGVGPAHVPGVALVDGGVTRVLLLTRGVVDVVVDDGAGPGLVLVVGAAGEEVGVVGQALDDVPVQREGAAQGLALLQGLVVEDLLDRVVGVPEDALAVLLDGALLQGVDVAVLADDVRGDRTVAVGGGEDGAAAAARALHAEGRVVGVTQVQADVQPVGDLLVHFQGDVAALGPGVQLHTVVLVPVHRQEHLGAGVAAGDGQVVAVGEGAVVDLLLDVVLLDVLVAVDVAEGADAVELGERVGGVGLVVRVRVRPHIIEVVVRAEGLQVLGRGVELGVAAVADPHLAFLGALRGHEDDAVGAARTVDRGGGGVLQHVDALDLVGRDVGQGARDAVDQDERVIALRDGAATAHADVHLRARTAVLRDDVHARELALDRLGDIRHRRR